jgi:hypothetical protein
MCGGWLAAAARGLATAPAAAGGVRVPVYFLSLCSGARRVCEAARAPPRVGWPAQRCAAVAVGLCERVGVPQVACKGGIPAGAAPYGMGSVHGVQQGAVVLQVRARV